MREAFVERPYKLDVLVISALGKLRQEDCGLEASLGHTVKSCLKKRKREAGGKDGGSKEENKG